MTEEQLGLTLGFMPDPEKNRLSLTESLDVIQLSEVFAILESQQRRYGRVNADLWMEFLPWHSLN